MVLKEIPFKVVDRQSEEDITRNILLQIIMEQESGGEPLFSADVLSRSSRTTARPPRPGSPNTSIPACSSSVNSKSHSGTDGQGAGRHTDGLLGETR